MMSKQSLILAFLLLCLNSPLLAATPVRSPEAVTSDEPVDFQLPELGGGEFVLSAHRGSWLVVNFWATWCGPCIEELPALQAFHDNNAFGAKVIAVNFEEIAAPALKKFVKQYDLRMPVPRIGKVPLVPFEPLVGLPSTFIVSPEGYLVHRHVGPITLVQLNEQMETLRKATGNLTPN